MKIRSIPTTTLLLCAAFHPVRTEIGFNPVEGRETYRSFEVSTNFGLESLSMRMNDQEMPLGDLGGVDPSELEFEAGYSLEVRDVFDAVVNGLPIKISRTYDEVSGRYDFSDESAEKSMEELEGETVVFTWNAESEQYDRAWSKEDEEADDEVLQALAADLDLRALLPSGDVEVGATWEVPASELSSLLVPGLDLARAAESDIEGMEEIPPEIAAALRDALEKASLQCTFRGLRGGEGGDHALIELALVAELTLDIAEAILANIPADTEFEGSVDEFTLDIYVDLAGELVWDQALGQFHTFDLGGDVAIDVYGVAEVDVEQMEFSMEFEAEVTGELSIEGTTVK